MLIHTKPMICFMILAVILAGCSTKAVLDNVNGQKGPAEKSSVIFSKEPSDKELFEDAISYLSNKKKRTEL